MGLVACTHMVGMAPGGGGGTHSVVLARYHWYSLLSHRHSSIAVIISSQQSFKLAESPNWLPRSEPYSCMFSG